MSKNTFVVLLLLMFVFLMLFIVACIVPSRGDVEIDLDGPTGGYNLQIAFSSGWCAAEAIIKNRDR